MKFLSTLFVLFGLCAIGQAQSCSWLPGYPQQNGTFMEIHFLVAIDTGGVGGKMVQSVTGRATSGGKSYTCGFFQAPSGAWDSIEAVGGPGNYVCSVHVVFTDGSFVDSPSV